ncbi:NAD-dependent epimerase/dehydratase family protein [Acidimicrobiia bacterium]|nr:NAD-dependent epimerase/dehydratase family protein [Acidimicrobiia bacterium]
MKKVLLTGASGFLGGAVANTLIKSDYFQLYAIVRNENKECRFNISSFSEKSFVYSLDLTNFKEVFNLINEIKPDYIIHTASLVDVNQAVKTPVKSFENSAIVTLNILESVRLSNLNTKIINHSSDKVYNKNTPPFDELMSLSPLHIYDVGKVTQEQIANSYNHHYGIKNINLRCANYYGPYDFDFNRLIPYICKSIVFNEKLTLRSDKNFSRDFLYIEEAALVNLKIMEKIEDNSFFSYGESLNFSQEKSYTIKSIIDIFSRIQNSRLEVYYENIQHFESKDIVLDCTKSKNLLNWNNNTKFEEGLEITLDFYKKYLKL